VRVAVVYFEGCPSWREAGRRMRLALDQAGKAGVAIGFVPVATQAEAASAGFRGSPTILVDGADLFPGMPESTGLSCRVYATAGGMAGVPGLLDLTSALQSRLS
jgi:hypothetical protein